MPKKKKSRTASRAKAKPVIKVKKLPKKRKLIAAKKAAVASPTERSGASASPSLPPVSTKIQNRPRPKTCRVVSVCNQKGGCGKTTSVINIAAGLALRGQRVLVVDLDSQGNATSGLGIQADDVELSTFDLLTDPKNTSIEDIVLETAFEGLHIAPGSIELSEFESKVASEIGRENRLKKALAPILSFYDFVIIDTPPSLGLLSVNALNAATEVQIALQAHPFAFDGLNLLLDSISLVREELNPKLQITGIIITMFDPRTKIAQEIVQKVIAMKELKGRVFKSLIHQNVKLTEATRLRKPIYYYNASCTGSHDYLNLSEEVCRQHAASSRTSSSKSTELQ